MHNALELGCWGGGNLSVPAGEYSVVGSTHVGFLVGGTAVLNLKDASGDWYISSSLLLSQKGYKKHDYVRKFIGENLSNEELLNDLSVNYLQKEKTLSKTYLQIPIVVGKNFNVNQNLSLFAEMGAYGAVALWSSGGIKHTFYPKTNLRTGDMGLSLGIGVDINRHLRTTTIRYISGRHTEV